MTKYLQAYYDTRKRYREMPCKDAEEEYALCAALGEELSKLYPLMDKEDLTILMKGAGIMTPMYQEYIRLLDKKETQARLQQTTHTPKKTVSSAGRG
jgi:hypothetical protein